MTRETILIVEDDRVYEEAIANMRHDYMVKPVPEWKLAWTIEMALHSHAFRSGLSRKSKQTPPVS